MISIVKYLSEALTTGVPDPDEAKSLTGHVARYWGNKVGAYTGGQVKGVRDNEAAAQTKSWGAKLAKERADHAESLKKAAQKLSDDTSGTEAAGHALKKGAQAAGEATGGFAKKAMEFAGDSPVAAAGAAALGAGYLLAKRKKNQPT